LMRGVGFRTKKLICPHQPPKSLAASTSGDMLSHIIQPISIHVARVTRVLIGCSLIRKRHEYSRREKSSIAVLGTLVASTIQPIINSYISECSDENQTTPVYERNRT
jgi:hypothetical protein